MQDLIAVYEAGDEDGRLAKERNWVEWERTCEVLPRWLPGPPGRILDVGGASGRYASWLSGLGYTVQVLDPVPRHVAQARARGLEAHEGAARDLRYPDGWADAVLLLGPLYHLPSVRPGSGVGGSGAGMRTRRGCRRGSHVSLGQAGRVCGQTTPQRPRSSAVYLLRVLREGHDGDGDAFDQISYNHDPDHLRAEFDEAGLVDIDVVGVEGPLGSFARQDPELNQVAISAARTSEHLAPHLSLHLLARERLV